MTVPSPEGEGTQGLTGFYLHPSGSLHDTGWGHPEHQGRLRALASAVGRELPALHGRVVQREPRSATEEEVLRVHTEEHVRRVRARVEEAGAQGRVLELEADTRVSGDSWEAALGGAGGALEAVEAVASGELSNAFVATRPPGHHATPNRAMGFCLVNSVAVAARHLQARGLARRILVVDWDVHHGNGTQDTFYEDGSVFYLSLHQWPHYPGTGAAEEEGVGAGLGTTLNVPLPAGTPRPTYLERFREALERAMRDFPPDFVLVSAGFDVLAGDPLGGQLLEPEDMATLTEMVLEVARKACQGKVVALLEGGYDPGRTGQGAAQLLRALAGVPRTWGEAEGTL